MMTYILIAGALFVGCVSASALGLDMLSVALYPIPVAVYVARRRVGLASGLVLCAAAAAWVSSGSPRLTLYYGFVAAIGFVLGLGILHRWTYGWTVTAAATAVGLLTLGGILTAWPQWVAYLKLMGDELVGVFEQQAREMGGERAEAMVENMRQLRDHLPEIGLGLLVWPIILEACCWLSITTAWMRKRFGNVGIRGSFREMRTTEWLVWAVIAVALLLFVEHWWPNPALRTVSVNAALGLSAIYWFNGLSVLAFVLDAFRPHFLVYAAVVFLMISSAAQPMFCIVGLFDTWWDFRQAVRRAIARRSEPPPAPPEA